MRARARVRRRRWPRLDILSIAVVPLGIAVVALAQVLDGAQLSALVQPSSALVVFGGTLAAVLISYAPAEILRAGRAAVAAFRAPDVNMDATAATLITLAVRAHRRGLPALEVEVETIADPLLRSGLLTVVDGVPRESLDDLLTVEMRAQETEEDTPPRIFEAAAGYAPTLGILGAVLGLMRVMEHLSEPGMLGSGIALAFVATVYGVGIANLVLLPVAGRLRERAALRGRHRELIVTGLHLLHQRTHPRLVAQQLRAFSARMPRIDELAAHAALRAPRKAGASA